MRHSGGTRSDSPADAAPFATVISSAGRRLLAAVNTAAAGNGLAPGMPLADALSFLPGLATQPANLAADAAALTRLAEWCGRYSPWTAPDGIDGVKIEITGCAHLWGGEATLIADLSRRLIRQTIGHRIAIAGTLGMAWGLARFAAADGQPALPAADNERPALAPLPVEALRLDPATSAGLRRVGLRRVGDLYAMPRDVLARRFGPQVALRLDQAIDAVLEPLSPLGEAPVRRVRLSFAEPIADPADLARAAERLAEDLVARLAREGMGARRLDLAFHRVDGHVEHIRLGTARPSRDPRHLAGLFIAKLDAVDPGFGIEDMILAVFAAEPLPPEQSPLTRDGEATEADGIAPLIDRIGARLGLDAIGSIASRESHIPERASYFAPTDSSPQPSLLPRARETNAGISFPLSRSRERVGVGVGAASASAPLKPPRPVRLFTPPEPITVIWQIPDDPPAQFKWRQQAHLVQRADGPERIAEEWWLPGASLAVEAVRDYYRIEDESGRRFWLFRAGLAGGDPPPRWFLHGLFA